MYTLLSALDPGLTFVIACKPGTEAIIPQDAFLPGVGVEGLAAPSPEDTLVSQTTLQFTQQQVHYQFEAYTRYIPIPHRLYSMATQLKHVRITLLHNILFTEQIK